MHAAHRVWGAIWQYVDGLARDLRNEMFRRWQPAIFSATGSLYGIYPAQTEATGSKEIS